MAEVLVDGTLTQSFTDDPIVDAADVSVLNFLIGEDSFDNLIDALEALVLRSGGGGGGGGLDQAAVISLIRSHVEDWAEDSNTATIPISKLTVTGGGEGQVLKIVGGVLTWRDEAVPLTNSDVQGIARGEITSAVEPFARSGVSGTIPGNRFGANTIAPGNLDAGTEQKKLFFRNAIGAEAAGAGSSLSDAEVEAAFKRRAANELVPSGGTEGQILAKKSGTAFDDEWVDLTVPDDSVGPAQLDADTEPKAAALRAELEAAKVFTLADNSLLYENDEIRVNPDWDGLAGASVIPAYVFATTDPNSITSIPSSAGVYNAGHLFNFRAALELTTGQSFVAMFPDGNTPDDVLDAVGSPIDSAVTDVQIGSTLYKRYLVKSASVDANYAFNFIDRSV